MKLGESCSFPKGAVIGPMVIAGVTLEKKYEKKITALGVKDSKQLSPKKREELAPLIEEIAKNIVVIKVPACKIDANRLHGINLDMIEAIKIAQIIEMSPKSRIYVDSLGQNPKKFERMIRNHLPKEKKFDLIVKNYLDESVPVVSAASVIAKVERDREIEEIKKKVGVDFGVGYSHDKRTIEFIKYLMKKGELPSYVRKTWITVENLKAKKLQMKIKQFLKRKIK